MNRIEREKNYVASHFEFFNTLSRWILKSLQYENKSNKFFFDIYRLISKFINSNEAY